jgi:DNA-binding transcriptional MerR regulator
MASVIFQIVSWPTLVIALLVFGFAPGAVLRLIALAFPRDDPRRRELRGELYAVPRIERLFWVFEQLEVGLCEGLPGRFARLMARVRGVPIQHAADQGLLSGEMLASWTEDTGYRGPTAAAAAGITHRQLEYWTRTRLVEPSVRANHGSQQLYGFRDILVLKVVKRLLDTGITLHQIRAAVRSLRERGIGDLAQITLMSDGVTLYECTSADEVVDLLQGGQGVFGIALGQVWREVDGALMGLPGEPYTGPSAPGVGPPWPRTP